MFFSLGVNSSQASARNLVVHDDQQPPSGGGSRDSPNPGSLCCLSPNRTFSSESSDTSRCSSPCVRSEGIRPGKWTHVSSRVSVRPLTPQETVSALERQRRKQEKRERRRLRKEAEHRDRLARLIADTSAMGDHEDTRSSGTGQEIYIPAGDSGGGGTIQIPPNSGDVTVNIGSREPESPGSRSNYGEFYWDTNGETNYHNTSSFEDDLLDFETGRGATAARLDRTQDDLNKFKRRIDNNVEQQKEYSDMMHALQQKLSEYRKHIAEIEGKMVGARQRYFDDGTAAHFGLDQTLFTDTSMNTTGGLGAGGLGGGYGGGAGGPGQRDRVELWSPARRQNINLNIWGENGANAGFGYGDTNANIDIRLDEERRRADDFRQQLDSERALTNDLASENERLRRQAQALDQELQDKARGFAVKERNLSQYLSDEQQKMLDLWTELQRVRKQFADLKDQTARDLENQRSEFTRVVRSAGNNPIGFLGLDHPGGSYTNDHILIETVRKMRDGGNSDIKALLEEMRAGKSAGSSESDAELHKELMKKYEESIERNIELESKGDDHHRKIAELEAELRRAKDKLNDSQSALKKLHEMAQDSEIQKDGTVTIKRSRSMSPGKTPVSPTEVLRAVRNALRNKDNDIQQLERKLKIAEAQAKEFVSKFETAEEQRRRLDKNLTDAKREIANQQKSIDENERVLRRLEDKLRNSESEKLAAEKARKFMEDELARLQEQYQKATSEDAKKIWEDSEEQVNKLEEDYQNRIAELNRRIENLVRDNTKLKQEMGPLKDKYRDLESDYNSMQRRLDEKDSQIRFLDNIKQGLQKDIEDLRTKCDVLVSDNEKTHHDMDAAHKQVQLYEQQLKDIKQQRDDFQKQKDEFSRSLFEIKQRIEDERKARNDALKNGERSNDEIDKLKRALHEGDTQIAFLQRHNDELDTTVKNNQAKIAQLENEIHSRNTEIQKLNDLNLRLQNEKQEVLNQKHKTDADNDALKEKARKSLAEVEKLQNEIKALEAERDRALAGATQEGQKATGYAKEVANGKAELAELQELVKKLEDEIKDLKDRLRNGGRRSGPGGTNVNINVGGGGAGGRETMKPLSQTRGSRPGSVYGPGSTGGGSGVPGEPQENIYDTPGPGDQRGGGSVDIPSNVPGGGDINIPYNGGRDGADGRPGYDGRDGGIDVTIDNRGYPGGIYDQDDELTAIRIRDINDKWKMEVEKLENEKDTLERKLQELKDELAQVGRGQDRKDSDLAELQRKHQAEIDKLKQEIAALQDKHLSDLDDEKEQYTKSVDSLKAIENELRNRIANLEKTLSEALNRENFLDADLRDRDNKIEQLLAANQKLKDDLEDLRNELDKEVQKWKNEAYTAKSEAKALETANAGLKAQLSAATDKADHLGKQVGEMTARIRELTSQVRRLEEDLADAKSNLLQKDGELESAMNRLRSLEDQFATLQSESSKWRSELDQAFRENDVLKNSNTNLESELNRLRTKLQQTEDGFRDLKNNYNVIKSERERLQNAFRDKAKQTDHLNQLSQTFENRMTKMRDELNKTSEKLIASETNRANLKNELDKIQTDLKFGIDQMQRKTEEYDSNLNDLRNAHRAAEDGRLNALMEVETKKYEVNDLSSRLDSAEQRLGALQQDFIVADQERDALADALRRFQASANRIININAFGDGGFGGVGGAGGVNTRIGITAGGGAGSFDQPGGTTVTTRFGPGGTRGGIPAPDGTVDIPSNAQDSIDGGGVPRSVPFPPGVDYTGGAGPAAGQHIDLSNLEGTLQRLLARIEQLEAERNSLRDELNRLQKKAADSNSTTNKREIHVRTIEESLQDIEDEKRGFEAKYNSALALLKSQEEAIKQRDEERRQMKSKMVAAELQARGKEAQLRHLNEQLKNLRSDLDNAHADIRILRDHEEQWDASRFQLESKNRETDAETQRLQLQIATFDTERQNLQDKVKQLDADLRLTEQKMSDLKDDNDKLKREISKAETLEIELRRQADQYSKTNQDYLTVKDQLLAAQNELNQANLRKQTMESELLNLRSELRDNKQRVHDVNSRVADLQRQLQDSNAEKNRLEDRILNLEKQITQQRSTETDLKQQLETGKNEKRQLVKDLEELRRRFTQLETEKVKNLHLLEGWKKERAQMLKKIEMLEADKRRTDQAIRETALQREAIEKSLNAMERENKELYKNCAQLQQQIAQLEMENGNRILELTNKQREEQEMQLRRMMQEKAQIEKVIENRERTHRNRIQQLEDQIRILREQMDQERRRRRDIADRALVSDIGRLGGNTLGIRSFGPGGTDDTTINVNLGRNGIHSAGGAFGGIIRDYGNYGIGAWSGGFGNYSGVRSTFASNPLTPPLGTSTPTHRPTYDGRPTSVLGRDTSGAGSTYGDRGSVYGGRSIDTPGPRDPSLVEIPKAEDDASKEIHVPSELKYDDGQSSMTSSHYSTLGRDHGL